MIPLGLEMRERELLTLVVLYNKQIEESLTIKSIKDNASKIYVWNNGPSEILGSSFEVFNSSKNCSLSYIYNSMVSYCIREGYKYLVIFDDDTLVDDCYYNELINDINSFGEYIYVPISESNEKIISPLNYDFNSPIIYKKKSIIKKITGIGSGIAVPVSREIKFDNMLSFYGVDHDFLLTWSKKGRVKLLDVVNKHTPSTICRKKKLTNFKFKSLLWSMIYCMFKHRTFFSSSKRIVALIVRRYKEMGK